MITDTTQLCFGTEARRHRRLKVNCLFLKLPAPFMDRSDTCSAYKFCREGGSMERHTVDFLPVHPGQS